MKKIGLFFLLVCSWSVFADSSAVIKDKIQLLQDQMSIPLSCSCANLQDDLSKRQLVQMKLLKSALVKAQASPSPSPSGK